MKFFEHINWHTILHQVRSKANYSTLETRTYYYKLKTYMTYIHTHMVHGFISQIVEVNMRFCEA